MKPKITLAKACVALIAVYFLLVAIVYFIVGDVFRYKIDEKSIAAVEPVVPVGEIISGFVIEQQFTSQTQNIEAFSVYAATYARENKGKLSVVLKDNADHTVVFEAALKQENMTDNEFLTFKLPHPLKNAQGRNLSIVITSDSVSFDNAVTVFSNPNVSLNGGKLLLNGEPAEGQIVFTTTGYRPRLAGKLYFPVTLGLGLLFALYAINLCRKEKNGKRSLGLSIVYSFQRYKFLLDQLVNRDFKTKYKRSVLGVLWSFLNPLLTMAIQYVVFSSLFRFDINNFSVYLLTGIVLFNFFSEATSMSLSSIVSNAHLITKVYIPKYIFPISRVMSSTINLLFSLIPLALVVLIIGIVPSPAMLLFPYGIACLVLFSMGVGMMLAAANVFFRDTQFLWGVVSMLWMYATPIIYPETILPDRFALILKLNPMYYIIKFSRTVIMDGVSPEPSLYVACFVSAFVSLLAGALIFRKAQNKFVLYI